MTRWLSLLLPMVLLLASGVAAHAQQAPPVKLVVEPPGENCEHGGTAVRSGLDTDGDGELSDEEITNVQYVCKEPPADHHAAPSPPSPPTTDERPVVPSPMGPLWHENTWDSMVELGAGVDTEDKGRFFARARGGVMWVREPFFTSLGAMVEVGPYVPFGAGIQTEVVHLWTGLWANLGASVDLEARPAAIMGVGWSIFGAEARIQRLGDDESVWTLFGKLRIPVRHLVFALSR